MRFPSQIPKAPLLKAPRLGLAVAAVGLALAAGPALAQTVDEVTVYGRLGPDGRPNTLSRVVDISDLDLRSRADVREMQRRVRYTARAICEELGETGGAGVTPSCVDAAVRGAQPQARLAIAQAREPAYYASNGVTYFGPPVADTYAAPASAVVPDDDIPPPEL
jgi:UrcA family protein